MKGQTLFLATLAAFALPAAAQEPADPLLQADGAPEAQISEAMSRAFKPAYRLAEGLSDGVYDAVRVHLFNNVLPGGLARNMARTPAQDSSAAFDQKLQKKESRYLERLRESYRAANAGARADPGRAAEWRAWAAEEQTSVLVDAMKDTLIDRYGLDPFGQRAGRYAAQRGNWDADFLARAAIVGGGFLYLNGLHATTSVGQVRLAVDVRSGLKLQKAIESGGDARRMAGMELGLKNKPLSLAAEWGVQSGRLRGESIGLKYRLRY